ncbi:hydrophobin-domain-containing protein [Amylocystis lapponica]|nr:hydrophobin-domain-containing protein [Amylocystis lapponica]
MQDDLSTIPQFQQLSSSSTLLSCTTSSPNTHNIPLANKMFAPIYTIFVVFYLALFAVAMPGGSPKSSPAPTKTVTVTSPAPTSTSAGQCNTGSIQCCQSTEAANSPAGSLLLGLLGVVVQGVDVLLGLDCSPINVVGVGSGNTCDASPVCCEDNSVGNLISIGCVPVSL